MGVRILVVDDHEDIVSTVRLVLEDEPNIEVQGATSGRTPWRQ